MRKLNKMSLQDLPAAILVFVFVALVGAVGLIIVSDFKTDPDITDGACYGVGVGTVTYNATSGLCSNTTSQFAVNTTSGYAFLSSAQVGIGKIGAKLGLLGTIVILAVVIGLVVTFFAIKNM